jgi:RNA polymerase sigma factor (sigma-70 family)
MAAGPDTLLRYIRRLLARPELDEATDAALLSRFISESDEKAFAALVDRHGPLVFHLCRRVLGDVHDAEDAFQATFLVLARKAARVHPREALPAWLHVVARRVALRARSAKIRQVPNAQPLAIPPMDLRPDPLADLSVRELLGILDEELERLPKVYRLPVILCGLESRSLEEAARQLGWTVGSVKGRLERGRARLHKRLIRRGATLTGALAAAELSRGAATASTITSLLSGTVRGASAFAACRPMASSGTSAKALSLAEDLIGSLSLGRLKFAAALLAPLVLLATGLAVYLAAPAPAPQTAQVQPGPDPGNLRAAGQDEFDAPIGVSGRVVGPDGQPVAGAKLFVGFTRNRDLPEVKLQPADFPLRRITGADGRFAFAFTRSELDAIRLDHSRPAVIAVKDGFGPAWTAIRDAGAEAELNLKLVKDVVVEGRILDQNRRPVAGATLFVSQLAGCSEEALAGVLKGGCLEPGDFWRGSLPERTPKVTTDANGAFRLQGLGQDRLVTFVLEAPGLQRRTFQVATRPVAENPPPTVGCLLAKFEYVAPAVRPIRGVVRDKATGRPVAGVSITAKESSLVSPHTAVTDDSGSYEILVPPESTGWQVWATPKSGQRYFAGRLMMAVKPGLDAITADFELVRGMLVHGRVTEHATEKPPKAAAVEYYPLHANPHASTLNYDPSQGPASKSILQPDGSYQLAVLPGPGVIGAVAMPRDWYAVALLDEAKLATLVKDGITREFGYHLRVGTGIGESVVSPERYHDLALINPGKGPEPRAFDLTVQRARPIRGTVVGPDGAAISGVRAFGLSTFDQMAVLEGASFTVHGLNPRSTRTVVFLRNDLGLGKTLTLVGDEAEPLTVQLEPYGAVVGRLVDANGKPIAELGLLLVGRNCPVDGDAYAKTDAQGQFRAALVPGCKYRLEPGLPHRLTRAIEDVGVTSGEIKELGDLMVGD